MWLQHECSGGAQSLAVGTLGQSTLPGVEGLQGTFSWLLQENSDGAGIVLMQNNKESISQVHDKR